MFGVIYCFMRNGLNLFISFSFHSYSRINRMTCIKTFQRNYPETNQTFFSTKQNEFTKIMHFAMHVVFLL